MENEWDLTKLKEIYNTFRKKYNLPSFDKLNEDFQIEKISDSETDFVLREIRTYMANKFINYLRFIESLINPPASSPMFVFALTKTLGMKEKEKLIELYKKIAKVDLDLIEMDIEYSEEKEAESIKKYFEIWQDIKHDLLNILNVIKKNLDAKIEEDTKSYFG